MKTAQWITGFRRFGAMTVLLLLIAQSSAEAIELRNLAFWRARRLDTLILTGNYAKPRLLAEQAQAQTNLPIVLVSQEHGGDEIYYLPSKPSAMRIEPRKFLEFVDVMLRPKRIVVLGDQTYVPARYVDMFKDRYPTIVISGNDWIANAEQLGKVLRTSFLARNYQRNLMQLLEAEAHQPTLEDYQMPSLP